MILTKTFVVLVTALVCVHGKSLQGSERVPSKSELITHINKLLQMLQEREHGKTHAMTTEQKLPSSRLNSVESKRQHMLQRRKKLDELLKKNPGLRSLLKTWVEKRKLQELRHSQDAGEDCWPGLFYCRDESENDDASRRIALMKTLVKMLTVSKTHANKVYCPPGFYFCHKPKNSDESVQHKARNREQLLKEIFSNRFSARGQSTKEMEDLDDIIRGLRKKQTEHGPKHKAEEHKVEFVRVPASVRKLDETDETAKRKPLHGEKLADDLMKSVQDTNKKSTGVKAADKESNFDLKQLMELLKE